MKLKLILSMLLPIASIAVQLLRDKDENSTGIDDIAADQLDTAIESLRKYLAPATEPLRPLD
jgi:hypothetical protein